MEKARIVSWNVCDDIARKIVHLERLRPDIAILQEVRTEGLADVSLDGRSVWIGDPGQKGLAVVAYGDWILTPVEPSNERWFLPVRATKGESAMHVVGVWVDSSRDCGPPSLGAIEELRPFLTSAPTVIGGDWNQTVRLDSGKGAPRRFSTVLQHLYGLGLHSAWHTHFGEAQGAESKPTYLHQRNRERPFHIDLVFSNMTVENVSVGDPDTYLRASDHMPVVVDYCAR